MSSEHSRVSLEISFIFQYPYAHIVMHVMSHFRFGPKFLLIFNVSKFLTFFLKKELPLP